MHCLSQFRYCPRCGSVHFVENDLRSKRCEECGFVFYVNASTAVCALILTEDAKLMMCRRAFEPYKGSLGLPGGFAEFGESAEEAVRREVYEEVGAEVTEMQYFMSAPNVYPFSGFDVHTLDFAYFCKVRTFKGLKASDDASEIIYVPIVELDTDLVKLTSLRLFVERAKAMFVESGGQWALQP